jgi:8-oxo-dGTP diphosphatase
VPHEFTLTELQEVFEMVLGKKIDKRNFRKKILKQKVIKETGNKKTI